MQLVEEAREQIPVKRLCDGLGFSRATYYREINPAKPSVLTGERPASPRALSPEEEEIVLAVLNSDRFCDRSPTEVYYTLLDEGIRYCSLRTMYRILSKNQEIQERRRQAQHPHYAPPQLLAESPNQVWTWDITKLAGPSKGIYYQLYVIIDIFSRFVVGWMVAAQETAVLAKHFIEETCISQGIQAGQLSIHADRGASMRSKPVASLLSDLGVAKSHSRPRVSNDNPFSESQFKTLKYCPEFPERFGSLEDTRAFCQDFFAWYNEEHRHSGIGYLTPAMVHYGEVERILAQRQQILDQSYEDHPERFVHHKPTVIPVPEQVWINPPEKFIESDQKGEAIPL